MHLNSFLKKAVDEYLKIFALNYVLILLSKLAELILLNSFHHLSHVPRLVITGTLKDLFIFSIALICAFPLYLLTKKILPAWTYKLYISLITLHWLIHFLILSYFIVELKPVDIFLFQYSLNEIGFTLRTAQVNLIFWLCFASVPIFTAFFLNNKPFLKKLSIWLPVGFLLISAAGHFGIIIFSHFPDPYKIADNKTLYFYKRSFKYFSENEKSKNTDIENIKAFQEEFKLKNTSFDFPLLHKTESENDLCNYFIQSDSFPNVVIIIVEGLNNRFVNDFMGIRFMPFLDSLKNKSLYWDHFLTNGERSFSVLPSLTGSLPYGEKGFTFLPLQPTHHNLVKVLNKNGYFTSFFYGQGAWMHNKDRFLKLSDIDLIFDKDKFSEKYKRIQAGPDNFFWGYNDMDLFNQYKEVSDTLGNNRRLDIFFTGSMHPPFAVAGEDYYNKKQLRITETAKDETAKKYFTQYQRYFKAIMFTDDAIRRLFEYYKQKESFEKTIFILTGDHPMTEIPLENSLKRYHVPLIIYSPLLKKSAVFKGVASHLDFYEPFAGLLKRNYKLKTPQWSSALSNSISTDTVFNWNKSIVFMNDNREIVDIYRNGYFLSNETDLFKVDPGLELKQVSDNIVKAQARKSLEVFRKTNHYMCLQNKLIPENLYYKSIGKTIFYTFEEKHIRTKGKEYIQLLPLIKMPNKQMNIDISFNFHLSDNSKMPSGVYQVKNSADSILLWNSFSFPSEETVYQNHIKIEKLKTSDNDVQVQLFLWNQNKSDCELTNIKLFVTD